MKRYAVYYARLKEKALSGTKGRRGTVYCTSRQRAVIDYEGVLGLGGYSRACSADLEIEYPNGGRIIFVDGSVTPATKTTPLMQWLRCNEEAQNE